MPQKARDDALAVYDLLAGAEAKAHGCEMEHIHFHELGTMDAVADVCAAMAASEPRGSFTDLFSGCSAIICAAFQLRVV